MTDMQKQKRDELALEKSFNFEKYDSGNGEEDQELAYEEGYKVGFDAATSLQAEKIKVLESEVERQRTKLIGYEKIHQENVWMSSQEYSQNVDRIKLLESCLKIAMDALTAANGMILKGWAGNLSCCEIALEQITAKMEAK